ncbi:SpvB/TcaC N-terminal domain-containing protein [Legionella israelensis]|uniref:SpvB/TcaC N-terminal domain-containing protein n=1 Tax=Legionella israelensis TaxID=454 RepID=UPI000889622A|nr:SpvB/TcaC N-terminal domain-containing protein [Legionella israelensis]QBS08408.1 hypothetical protein E4T55_00185 [Legionella israelensis]SCX91918.1 RHS repeat-associated core domain-containing protein [Legionella israelensis DSM 19235]
MATEGNSSIQNVLSLPKSGGALQGIGESFQPDLFTGTGNFSIPIHLSHGRDDFTPSLTLQYSSGHGNGCFGLGWQLSIPCITRKTSKGLPRYNDDDVFVLSGSDDLIPLTTEDDPNFDYIITSYCPRIEGLFARIEQWVRKEDSDTHWRATDKNNITSVYGRTKHARLFDPENEHHVYQWLLEETYDSRGNHILYEYARDATTIPAQDIYEENRNYAQLYIRRIYYGNLPSPLIDEQGNAVTYPGNKPIGHLRHGLDHNNGVSTVSRRYAFEVVFDYGDWNSPVMDYSKEKIPIGQHPEPLPSANQENFDKNHPVRADPFSNFRSGFEIRTLRQCLRILMFHHFKELGGPALVSSTDFAYAMDENSHLSFLNQVTVSRYQKDKTNHNYIQRRMPSIDFKYTEFQPQKQRYQSIEAKEADMPPLSLKNQDTALLDVFGDGMPDIVQSTSNGFHYWRNLGEGQLDQRHIMHHSPAGVMLSQAGVGFGDIGGDGKADLLVHHSPVKGFYEMTDDAGWSTAHSFKIYEKPPIIDFNDPNARLIDLTGDGLPDLLLTKENSFVWQQSKGEDGYDVAEWIPRIHDLNLFPDVFFADPSERVRLADMSGDGLKDVVLLHNGRIDYWPNIGYGRFGKRITMKNTPLLEAHFNPARLFLVDINGTGIADLVYVDTKAIYFWFNQNGNSWSEKQVIYGTPVIHDLSAIDFVDFFGTGTTCLIWSNDYASQPGSNYKVLDFCGGYKPYLLTEMKNQMGTTTRVQYASSTKFFLEDEKEASTRWISHLPFPVQVVEKVETIDHANKTKHVVQYRYHHGYFDGREREFRGFGRVDTLDTEHFNTFHEETLHGDLTFKPVNINSSFHLPPVLTKTWFHTGIYYEKKENGQYLDEDQLFEQYRKEFYAGDLKAFKPGNNKVPVEDKPHEAYRTLRGAMLRTEIYAQDGSDRASHPYKVTETLYEVTRLHDSKPEASAVFYSLPFLSISYQYERNPNDPRISQELLLKKDKQGNVLLSANIIYPRRPGHIHDGLHENPQCNASLQALMQYEQSKTHIIVTNKKYIEPLDSTGPGAFRHSLPCETRVYELTGIEPLENVCYTANEIQFAYDNAVEIPYESLADNQQLNKRLMTWNRTFFRKDKAANHLDSHDSYNDRLSLGKIEPLGLPYESYQAIMSRTHCSQIYRKSHDTEEVITDAMMEGHNEAGYVEMDNYWWIPSGRDLFSPELFYETTKHRDPFNQITSIHFDPYVLLPLSITNPLDQITEAKDEQGNIRLNYRVMQPEAVRDVNQNVSEVLFDTLGMVIATAVKGKGDDADSIEGIEEIVTEAQLTDPIQHEQTLLGKATSRTIYQFSAVPGYVHTLNREIHHADLDSGATSRIQHQRIYFDALGRTLQTKRLLDEGKSPEQEPGSGKILLKQGRIAYTGASNQRWQVSGWTILNNKGNPVQKYEPFYTDRLEFEFDIRAGVTAVLFYDPLQRVIATLHPDHTYEKVLHSSWHQMTWDAGDTLLLTLQNDPDIQTLVHSFLQSYRHPLDERAYKSWYDERISDRANKPSIDNPNTPPEQKAALQAEAYADTPAVIFFNGLKQAFISITDNKSEKLVTLQHYDLEGNIITTRDAKASDQFLQMPLQNVHNLNEWPTTISFRYQYDMAGRMLKMTNPDSGEKIIFFNVRNQPCRTWDENGNETKAVYDALHRQTELWIKTSETEFGLAEKIIYGEAANDPVKNLHGKPWKIYDGAGLLIHEKYDFKGNTLKTTRRLLKNGMETAMRWPIDSHGLFDENNAQNQLQPDSYTVETKYDALNRIIETKTPDKTLQKYSYNHNGYLNKLQVKENGNQQEVDFIKTISYNEHNQRVFIQYGNNVVTEFTYDADTARLTCNLTRRGSSAKALLDLNYCHDAVGNITQIENKAQATVFNHNQAVTPISSYRYDALYRLTQASGREHESMNACHYQLKDQKNTAFYAIPQPQSNTHALLNYTEKYEYDKAFNLKKISHHNSQNSWVRQQTYANNGNQLLTSHAGCQGESNIFSYDKNGNLLHLAHLPLLQWNFKNQLTTVQLNVSDDPDFAFYQYDASGQRVRKTIVKKGIIEERIYIGGYEVYRKVKNGSEVFRRETVHIVDNQQRIALIETRITDTQLTESGPGKRVRYQLTNHLNACVMEVDDTPQAKLISYEEYYAYGGTSYIAYSSKTGLSVANRKRYRYSGKERDDETGLYYYGQRYYIPWLGRWASCDPAGTKDSLNLYLFLKANPIRFTDPNGTDTADNIKADINAEMTKNLNLELELAELEAKIEKQQSIIEEKMKKGGDKAAKKAVKAQIKEMEMQKKRISLMDELKQSDKKIKELHTQANNKLNKRLFRKATTIEKNARVLNEISDKIQDFYYVKGEMAMAKAGELVDNSNLLKSLREFKTDNRLIAKFSQRINFFKMLGKGNLLKTTTRSLGKAGGHVLGVFADTPMSDGGEGLTPDFFDPHFADRIDAESNYFGELIKYKNGLRDTEPTPPWTQPDELNALGKLGVALQEVEKEHKIFETAQTSYGNWLGDLYDDYHEWRYGASQ